MTRLILPFFCLAVVGLILSLVSHMAALLELPQPLGEAAWVLHVGIFVVMFPVVILGNRMAGSARSKDYWEVVLRGCPRWARWLTYAFFFYAIVNFVSFMAVAPPKGFPTGTPTPPVIFRGFSGHWMAFYSTAAAILYSALVVGSHGPKRCGPCGHVLRPGATFCEECGTRIE